MGREQLQAGSREHVGQIGVHLALHMETTKKCLTGSYVNQSSLKLHHDIPLQPCMHPCCLSMSSLPFLQQT